MEPTDVKNTLLYQQGFYKSLGRIKGDITILRDRGLQEQVTIENQIGICELSKEFYQKAVDVIYQHSIGEVQKVLDLAIPFIFYDRSYRVLLSLEDGRGDKELKFKLVDSAQEPQRVVDMKSGVGMGVRTVVSFVMNVFYLMRVNAEMFLIVDESYMKISPQYRDRFYSFLKSFSDQHGLALVLITNDPVQVEYADRTYVVADGVVTEGTYKEVEV